MAASRWAIVLGVFAFLIAVIAFIMVVVAYTNPSVLNRDSTTTTMKPTTDSGSKGGTSGQSGSMGSNTRTPVPSGGSGTGGGQGGSNTQVQKPQPADAPEKIYVFAIGKDWKPYEYLDESTGTVRGLHKDFVNAVCDRMKKRCDFYVSDYGTMWDDSKDSSRGLWDSWYDGTMSWSRTPERLRTYAFLGNLFQVHNNGLFVTKDSITRIDPENHKVGFRKSWAASPQCLKREKKWDVKNVRMYDDFVQLKAALKNGDVDVAMLEQPIPASEGLRQIEGIISCTKGGYALMVRKDEKTNMAWFEEGANAFMKTSEYKQQCYVAKKIHGGDPKCYP